MAWLAALIAAIAEKLIAALGKDILDYLAKEKAIAAADVATLAEASASMQSLKDAKDGKGVDSATDSALGGT